MSDSESNTKVSKSLRRRNSRHRHAERRRRSDSENGSGCREAESAKDGCCSGSSTVSGESNNVCVAVAAITQCCQSLTNLINASELKIGVQIAAVIAAIETAVPVPPTLIRSLPYVISTPGNYVIGQNLTYDGANAAIEIQSNNVNLNMMQFSITVTDPAAYGVQIGGNTFLVTVQNGWILSPPTLFALGIGVLVLPGASRLTVSDVAISGFGNGVVLEAPVPGEFSTADVLLDTVSVIGVCASPTAGCDLPGPALYFAQAVQVRCQNVTVTSYASASYATATEQISFTNALMNRGQQTGVDPSERGFEFDQCTGVNVNTALVQNFHTGHYYSSCLSTSLNNTLNLSHQIITGDPTNTAITITGTAALPTQSFHSEVNVSLGSNVGTAINQSTDVVLRYHTTNLILPPVYDPTNVAYMMSDTTDVHLELGKAASYFISAKSQRGNNTFLERMGLYGKVIQEEEEEEEAVPRRAARAAKPRAAAALTNCIPKVKKIGSKGFWGVSTTNVHLLNIQVKNTDLGVHLEEEEEEEEEAVRRGAPESLAPRATATVYGDGSYNAIITDSQFHNAPLRISSLKQGTVHNNTITLQKDTSSPTLPTHPLLQIGGLRCKSTDTTNVTVTKNRVHETTGNPAIEGVLVTGSSGLTFSRTTVSTSSGTTASSASAAAAATTNLAAVHFQMENIAPVLENNNVHGAPARAIYIDGNGNSLFRLSGNKVSNTTDAGVLLGGGANNGHVEGTTAYLNACDGIRLEALVTMVQLQNNSTNNNGCNGLRINAGTTKIKTQYHTSHNNQQHGILLEEEALPANLANRVAYSTAGGNGTNYSANIASITRQGAPTKTASNNELEEEE